MLQTLLNTPKIIRNIQFGTINGGNPSVELSGFVNLNKMVALVMGSVKENSRWTVTSYYVETLSIDSITFNSLNGTASISGGRGSYVVFEFI